MGCGSSRSAAVAPMMVPEMAHHPQKEQTTNKVPDKVEVTGEAKAVTGNIIRVKEVSESCDSIPVESQYGSTDSIPSSAESNGSDRQGSAKSNDSGIGRGECTDVIMEKSSLVLKDIASPPENAANLELEVSGKQMKTPGPIGHRKRSHGAKLPPVDPRGRQKIKEQHRANTEQPEDRALEAILQKHVQFTESLIEELPTTSEIIKRPVSRGGVAFDINSSEDKAPVAKRPFRKPACVVKYAQHKRAADVVTHEELDEKQRAADQRRKEQEQMRLERIWAQEEKDRQIAEALAKFAAMQTELKSDTFVVSQSEKQQPTKKKKSVTLTSKKPSAQRAPVKATGTG